MRSPPRCLIPIAQRPWARRSIAWANGPAKRLQRQRTVANSRRPTDRTAPSPAIEIFKLDVIETCDAIETGQVDHLDGLRLFLAAPEAQVAGALTMIGAALRVRAGLGAEGNATPSTTLPGVSERVWHHGEVRRARRKRQVVSQRRDGFLHGYL